MKKLLIIILLLIFIAGLLFYFLYKPIPKEQGNMHVFFCPSEDCEKVYVELLSQGTAIKCAFYDLRLESIQELLLEKRADVLLDEDNHDKFPTSKKISHSGLMHNKFCVIDEKIVITGSFNPTHNTNDNNLLVIVSPTLAKNYLEEFIELQQRKQTKTKVTKLYYNDLLLENYFCPEDNCQEITLRLLDGAENTIYFMIFTFTDKKIANKLLDKSSLDVRGVVDKTQAAGKYSVYKKLNGTIPIQVDRNPKFLHHKVFIIDNNTVLLGSYNPTKAGNEKNDENILIIREPMIVKQFLEEFEQLTLIV